MLYKYKNEEGCRDDTVPKSSDTRRSYDVGVRGSQKLVRQV